MNIYGIDAGTIEVHMCIDHENMVCYTEPEHIIAIVAAESRGQARAIVARKHKLEYMHEMKIRQLFKDCPLSERPDRSGDITDKASEYIWWLFGKTFHPDTTPNYLEFRRQLAGDDPVMACSLGDLARDLLIWLTLFWEQYAERIPYLEFVNSVTFVDGPSISFNNGPLERHYFNHLAGYRKSDDRPRCYCGHTPTEHRGGGYECKVPGCPCKFIMIEG
jgi:hypothetical protein